MRALHGTSRPPLAHIAPVGRVSKEQAARLERAAQDAGHTEASFLRLLAFHGYPSAEAVGPWHFDALLTMARDRGTARRLRNAQPFDGEPAHATTCDADDPARAYRVALTSASWQYLSRAAERELASVADCADLARGDVSEPVRAATIVDAADRLTAVVDEMRARLSQHAAMEPVLAALKDTLSAGIGGNVNSAMHPT